MEKYYIYHIKDKKWGCTKHLKQRLAKQGYTLDDVCEIIKIYNLDEAANLEKELNLKHGYFWCDTQDYRKVVRNSKYGATKAKEKKSKAVLKYDLQGNFIAEYGSILDAKQRNPKASALDQVCRGITYKSGGFIWKYKETDDFPKKISVHRNKWMNPQASKSVLQFDLQGNFIKEYPSQREAQRQTGAFNIKKVCEGINQHAGGFIWKYKL